MADRFPWREGALRIAVPISDEGAFQGGNTCDAQDTNSIDNAIEVRTENDVTASPTPPFPSLIQPASRLLKAIRRSGGRWAAILTSIESL